MSSIGIPQIHPNPVTPGCLVGHGGTWTLRKSNTEKARQWFYIIWQLRIRWVIHWYAVVQTEYWTIFKIWFLLPHIFRTKAWWRALGSNLVHERWSPRSCSWNFAGLGFHGCNRLGIPGSVMGEETLDILVDPRWSPSDRPVPCHRWHVELCSLCFGATDRVLSIWTLKQGSIKMNGLQVCGLWI